MLVFLILLAMLVVRPYLSAQFPYTHDAENHLARFANYKLALKDGQFPPRWAPNLLNHYGYPVFNYNYPLANILSVPFSLLKINYELTFKILVFVFVLFGLYGMNLWLKKFSPRLGPRLVGLLSFATAPYLINILYFRGNIGELMAMMILPWLFYFIDQTQTKVLKRNFLALIFATGVWTMFFLSHNIMVLFGTPLLVIYALARHRRQLLEYKSLVVSFSTGLMLSLWFWLPAILEKQLVIIENADLSKGYLNHFPTLQQLLFAPLQFGFSLPGSVDSLSFKVGWIFLIALVILPLILRPTLKKIVSGKTGLLLLFAWLLLIFQLPITQFIWSKIPLANYIQFPWRLSLFLVVVSTPLIVKLVSVASRWIKVLVVACLVAHILALLPLRPIDYFHREIVTYDVYSASTSTANENMPQDFTFEYFADQNWQPTAQIIAGEGTVTVDYWHGSVRSYWLNLATPATIIEPTANFAGWETTANGRLIEYFDNDVIDGRIGYQLPAGEFEVTSKFTQNTLPRQLGNTLSLLAAIVFVLLIIEGKFSAKKIEIKKLALWFVLWRGWLFIIGSVAPKLLAYKPSFPYAVELPFFKLPAWLYSWANFDGIHYLTIIRKGYFGTGLIQAFFPLYPNLARFLNLWQNPMIAGLMISNLFALMLIISLYQIGKIYFPRITWLGLLVFLTFPTSFFFGALYSESLFLVLVLQAFIATHHHRWWRAALLAGLASATRVVGVFVIVGVLAEFLISSPTIWQLSLDQLKKALRVLRKHWYKVGILALLGSSGLFVYMAYLQWRFNDALYFFHVQNEFGNGRQESLILYPQVVWRYFKILVTARPFDLKYFAYVQEAVVGVVGLLLLFWSSKKIRVGHLLFCLAAFFIPVSTGTFSSLPRYFLVIWPVYFFIAEKLQASPWKYLYFATSIALLILNTILFIQGYWVA